MYFFDELEDGLYISPTPRKSADINDLPVTAILNVCDKDPPDYAINLPPSIKLARCYFPDEFPVPSALLENAVLELALLRSEDKSTLVHCRGGNSRSPTVIFLYWMARDGIDWDTAYKRMRSRRLGWLAHPNKLLPKPDIHSIVDNVSLFLGGQQELIVNSRETVRNIEIDFKG